MNERIRELTVQAWEWADDAYEKQNNQFVSYGDNPIGYTTSQLFEQKFAELIVKECVNFGMVVFLNDHKTVPVFPAKQIKQHFGVK